MQKVEIIKIKEQPDIGLTKLKTDVGKLYRWGRRRYRATHPKEVGETLYGRIMGEREHWNRPSWAPPRTTFGKKSYVFEAWFHDHYEAKAFRERLELNGYATHVLKKRGLYLVYRGKGGWYNRI